MGHKAKKPPEDRALEEAFLWPPGNWLQYHWGKIIIVAVVAVALAVLTILLLPTDPIKTFLPGAGHVNRFKAAAVVGATFIIIAVLVYFVAKKTLWDLLQVLIVPFVLVGIGLVFEMQQTEREELRAEVERELADQRAQDEALQAYFDQMSTLLLKQKLRETPVGSEVRMLARARTLTVLSRVGSYRKRSVLLFLNDSGLINRQQNGTASEATAPVVSLEAADLRGAKLKGSNVFGAAHFGTPKDASQAGASLPPSQSPSQTPMDMDTSQAGSSELTIPGADLSGVNLSGADLRGTSLVNADLTRIDLSEARLKNADFTGADLTDAVLTSAKGISAEKLKRQAFSLQNATMPDGQRWTAATQSAPSSAPEIEPEGEVPARNPASKPYPKPPGEAPPPPPSN